MATRGVSFEKRIPSSGHHGIRSALLVKRMEEVLCGKEEWSAKLGGLI